MIILKNVIIKYIISSLFIQNVGNTTTDPYCQNYAYSTEKGIFLQLMVEKIGENFGKKVPKQ